eukprot:13747702-Alexandrium_andersonii.AAC.1
MMAGMLGGRLHSWMLMRTGIELNRLQQIGMRSSMMGSMMGDTMHPCMLRQMGIDPNMLKQMGMDPSKKPMCSRPGPW